MLKKTILACVLFHLVVGTISSQKIDSIDVKSCVLTINSILMIRLIPLF